MVERFKQMCGVGEGINWFDNGFWWKIGLDEKIILWEDK